MGPFFAMERGKVLLYMRNPCLPIEVSNY